MNPPYSVLADWLSKYHTAPVFIQALWIVSFTALALALLHTIRIISVTALKRMRDPQIELVYGICRDRSGRLMVYPEVKEEPQRLTLPSWRDKVH